MFGWKKQENNTVLDKEQSTEAMKKKRFWTSPYMLVLPALLFYLLFWAYPVFTAIREVFTSVDGGFSFENIQFMLADEKFYEALRNTLIFAVVSIILQFFLALALALLINRNFKGSSLFLFVMMIPMAIPIAAVGIIWDTGLTEFGWVNSLLSVTGIQGMIEGIGLLDGNYLWKGVTGLQAVGFLILIDTWTVLPSVMIIILAGLQNLNKEYSEAALVFGANRFQSVKDIVVPIIKPTIITSLLLRIISGVQVWLISVMVFDFDTVPFLVERIVYYTKFFYTDQYEKLAIAYSLLVMVIVMSIAYLFLRANNKAERGNA
jgi:multiple sugar transport system permease protein